jgi:hypothetical protein
MLAVLYPVILFILLSPNILLRLPPGGDKFTVVLVHALVFGLVLHFTSSMTSGYGMFGGGFGGGGAPIAGLGAEGGEYGGGGMYGVSSGMGSASMMAAPKRKKFY